MDPLFPVEDRICREADSGNDELAGFLFTDDLTGLQNGRSFRYHIERFRDQADRRSECFSLLYIDVDQFRMLNEKYGLIFGESTLMSLAGILKDEFSDSGVVFRYAGDEFLIILPQASEPRALTKARQLQSKIGTFFEAGFVNVTVSIAVAVYPNHGGSVPSLLQALDRTLKLCKSKGTRQVLPVSAIHSATEASSKPSNIRIRCLSLVGRTPERERLHQIFIECNQNKGQFVFITGEEGIGKSILLQNFLHEVREKTSVVFYNGPSTRDRLPNEILRAAIKNGIQENPVLHETLSAHAGFEAFYSLIQRNFAKNGQSFDDEDFCRKIVELLRIVSEKRVAILALDDVQPQDALVLSLLQILSRELRDQRVMVIAVIRKDFELSPILNWFIQSMVHASMFEEINLKALSQEECGQVVTSILCNTPIHETLRDWALKESQGNPFYIEELIQLAIEEGLIVLSKGAADIKKTDRVLIPDSVRDQILRRVKSLSDVHQSILGLAAVVGYECDSTFLTQVLLESNRFREEMIEELVEMHFFQKRESGKVHFLSERVRDLIYEEMGKFNRRMYHEKVAKELEKRQEQNAIKSPELAYHYARTGDLRKAIHYLCESESVVMKAGRSDLK